MLLDAAHNPAGRQRSPLSASTARRNAAARVRRDARQGRRAACWRARCRRDRAVSCHAGIEPALGRSGRARASAARALAPDLPSTIADSPLDALARAWRSSPRIVVAGSIFLLGDVHEGAAAARDTLRISPPLSPHATDLSAAARRVARLRRLHRAQPQRTGQHSPAIDRLVAMHPGEHRREALSAVPARSSSSRATRSSTRTRSSSSRTQDRAIATGNVVVTQGNNRIAADRADFNTKTQLGTFYNASGIATVSRRARGARPRRHRRRRR